MVAVNKVILAVLSAAAAAAAAAVELQIRDGTGCGDQALIVAGSHRVCCPGVLKNDSGGKALCCYGGTSTCKQGQVTCFNDLSSCKDTFDVDDPNYAKDVKSKTGVTVNTPSDSGSDGNNNGGNTTIITNGSSTSSAAASATASTSEGGAVATNAPVFRIFAGLAAIPVAVYAF